VRESGYLPSAGGRRTAQLSIVGEAAYVLGAEVGERGVSVGLFDLELKTLDRAFTPIHEPAGDPSPVVSAVLEGVVGMRQRHPDTAGRVLGVGLGMPGIVETTSDANDPVIYAQSLGWRPVRLADLFHDSDLTLFAENGAKTQTTSEYWFGAAQGVGSGLVALIGRGIGVGVIRDGHLPHGVRISASEWGHTKMAIGGPRCRCGSLGCLEAFVGGEAIGRRWRELGGTLADDEEATLKALLVQAEANDPVATRVVQETVEILGVAMANLVNLFGPERIVLGGWAGHLLAATQLGALQAVVRANALDHPGERVEVVAAKLGADSVPIGAALLVVEALIDGALTGPGGGP
jgi:predicted NBD/HSP70 family sugar kinase